MSSAAPIADDLRAVNELILEGERTSTPKVMEDVVAEDLVFRRAGGALVGKDAYLDSVKTTKYTRLEAHLLAAHQATPEEGPETAVVSVLVDARVLRQDGTVNEGLYTNLRMFVRGGPKGWLLRAWLNAPASDVPITAPSLQRMPDGLGAQVLHHAAVPVRDAATSREFYATTLGLAEIDRPKKFKFAGAWFGLGDRHLHLIQPEDDNDKVTFRADGAGINSHDVHFALRVPGYRAALEHFLGLGYHANTQDDAAQAEQKLGLEPGTIAFQEGSTDIKAMKVSVSGGAGFPQIYILDPDRNVIEINAANL
jgi:catechol 2,3-dioxygenase-like lactoylglutathione lyase family enzyme